MKIAIITDTHFGARNDNHNFNDYFYKFYENVFFPTLKERGITTCVHMGDVVDRRKYISYRIAHDFRKRFIGKFQELGIDFHIVIGNHDTYYKNTNKVNSMEELVGTDRFKIYVKPEVVEFDDVPILLVPWINDNNYDESMKALAKSKADILMGHLEVNGFMMNVDTVVATDGWDKKLFKRFDVVFSGHFHHKSDNGNVYYLGNPYEITWSDYNDPRGFHIFDTKTRELEFIQNSFHMFHKIYYDDENTQTMESIQAEDYSKYKDCYVKIVSVKKTNPFIFETLVDKLYKEGAEDISVVENFAEFENMNDIDDIDQAEDTMTILSKYVNSMKIDNKQELDTLMKSLYTEALAVETI